MKGKKDGEIGHGRYGMAWASIEKESEFTEGLLAVRSYKRRNVYFVCQLFKQWLDFDIDYKT